MTPTGVTAFCDRARALVDAAPPRTRAETQRWLVEPLLTTLGWETDTTACVRDGPLPGRDSESEREHRLEYRFSVEGIPALFVAVEAFDTGLEDGRERRLSAAMAATGVDRAIYTDGRTIRLLAGADGTDRFTTSLESLEEATSNLEFVSRPHLERRLGHHSRALARRRLAVERAAIEATITETLTVRTGTAYRGELERASRRFLDEVLDTFGGDGQRERERFETAPAETDGPTREATTPARADSSEPTTPARADSSEPTSSVATSESDTRARTSETASEDGRAPGRGTGEGETASTDSSVRDSSGEGGKDGDSSGEGGKDGDGEYVVRFFNERGSIGAVGHATSAGALVSATEYLFERGLSGVRLPWAPEDGHTVLHTEAVRADGTPMDEPATLENGTILETGGTPAQHRARLEALVERAGLRAMFTGDWPD
ncbi:hypothetical protein [Natronobiforma cellulositropha]|uniref:hypothetical protein n=1 Tax=Natronobiforma cellulositropha TaxID=1679076 RepID=UPI0021D5FF34|nr:hypothetical protein [Natronobiforma cellulositropha]